MTGPSDGLDDEGVDPVESLLRHPVALLPPRPGSFQQIRRAAARRRRTRVAGGTALALAVAAGSLLFAGTLRPAGPAHVPQTTTPPPPSLAQPTTAAHSPSPTASRPGRTAPSATAAVPAGGALPSAAASTSPVPPSPSAAPPTPGAPMCATSQLAVSLGGSNAGAGQIYTALVLTNRGSTPCHLTGFPGVSLLDAAGRQIGPAAAHAPLSYRPVVLPPGGSASATVHTANRQTSNPGECLPASTRIRVYPPGNTAAAVIDGSITDCDSTFTVTPVAPGATGNPPS